MFQTQDYQTLQRQVKDQERNAYRECQDARKSVQQYVQAIDCDEDERCQTTFSDVEKARDGKLTIKDTMELLERLIAREVSEEERLNAEVKQLEEGLEKIDTRIGKAQEQEKAKTNLEDVRRREEENTRLLKEKEEVFHQEEEKKPQQEEIKKQLALLGEELAEYEKQKQFSETIKQLVRDLEDSQRSKREKEEDAGQKEKEL